MCSPILSLGTVLVLSFFLVKMTASILFAPKVRPCQSPKDRLRSLIDHSVSQLDQGIEYQPTYHECSSICKTFGFYWAGIETVKQIIKGKVPCQRGQNASLGGALRQTSAALCLF